MYLREQRPRSNPGPYCLRMRVVRAFARLPALPNTGAKPNASPLRTSHSRNVNASNRTYSNRAPVLIQAHS